jgi:hypothetical protein
VHSLMELKIKNVDDLYIDKVVFGQHSCIVFPLIYV